MKGQVRGAADQGWNLVAAVEDKSRDGTLGGGGLGQVTHSGRAWIRLGRA